MRFFQRMRRSSLPAIDKYALAPWIPIDDYRNRAASIWRRRIGMAVRFQAGRQRQRGRVDLLVKLESPLTDSTALALRYNALLQIRLGLQKFDVLVIDPSTPLQPTHLQALAQGVRL